MVYCAKCGKQNDDDATYCKHCGSSLQATSYDTRRHQDQRCEEECAGGKNNRGWAMFWGIIIILVGLSILFELVLKQMADTYSWLSWVNSVQWNWIFAGVIALFIIIFGIRVISRK